VKKNWSRKLLKLLVALAICFLLVFLSPKGFFDPLRGLFLGVAYPFQKTFYIISQQTGRFFKTLSSISELKDENEKLLKENRALSSRVADLRGQEKENEELRNQLKLAPREKFDLEASFVIGQNPEGQGSWIMIDKGRENGVGEGMPVIVSEGILVGKVEEVFTYSAKVLLLTDSSSFVNAINLESGARGILTGEYSLGLTFGMVAQTDVLNVGDNIVTSGLGGSFPKGLLIGKIQNTKNTQDKLFQQALVSAKVKYSDLETVFVVKKEIP
jgi:rod shape-determining protein MreC